MVFFQMGKKVTCKHNYNKLTKIVYFLVKMKNIFCIKRKVWISLII